MNRKLIRKVEEAVLVVIILINVFEFFGGLFTGDSSYPRMMGTFDFAKKVLSWTLMGYLFYKLRVAHILFGERPAKRTSKIKNWHIDLAVVISYFLLIFKNVITSTEGMIEHSQIFGTVYKLYLFGPLIEFIQSNAVILDIICFYSGIAIMVIVSIILAVRFDISRPSMMHMIHEEGPPPSNLFKIGHRIITIFLLLSAFFIVIFNLMAEWLAIAVDNAIIMVGITFYLILIIRYHKHFSPNTLIHRVGSFGESFYETLIEKMQSKSGLRLVISAMLVLHILTDIGNYVLPYVFTFREVFYLEHLGASTHMPLIKHFVSDLSIFHGASVIPLSFIYLMNLVALVLLMVLPAVIWYNVYTKKGFKVRPWTLSLFYTSLCVFIIAPLFKIKQINMPKKAIVGVDIITHQVQPMLNIFLVLAVALLVGLTAFILARKELKKILVKGAVLSAAVFFIFYVSYFCIDTLKYNAKAIQSLFISGQAIIGSYMALFLMITLCFYVFGLLVFIRETFIELKMLR